MMVISGLIGGEIAIELTYRIEARLTNHPGVSLLNTLAADAGQARACRPFLHQC